MSISLKDGVKPYFGFQGALQGAGTTNQAGIVGFFPLSVGEYGVFFADVLFNANFADYGAVILDFSSKNVFIISINRSLQSMYVLWPAFDNTFS